MDTVAEHGEPISSTIDDVKVNSKVPSILLGMDGQESPILIPSTRPVLSLSQFDWGIPEATLYVTRAGMHFDSTRWMI